jgi:hypothetical protein
MWDWDSDILGLGLGYVGIKTRRYWDWDKME